MAYKYLAVLTEAFLRQRYIDERRSTIAIAAETGINPITISQYIRKYGIPMRSHVEAVQRQVAYAGFEEVTDDWHAYWIGLLAADGCVYVNEKEGHARVVLTLKASDIAHVRAFQQGIQTTAPVLLAKNGITKLGHEKQVAKISISNPHLARALMKWGLLPNKTLTLTWPAHFPSTLIPAYNRGYFDGDGTVYQRRRSRSGLTWTETVCRFISGSGSFLEVLEGELNMRGIVTQRIYRNQQSNAFVLPVSGKRENLVAFATLLYQHSTVSLERKRAIFQDLEVYHAAHPRTEPAFIRRQAR